MPAHGLYSALGSWSRQAGLYRQGLLMAAERNRVGWSAKGAGRARMLVAALLGALMLNPPILEIFSSDPSRRLLGWPLVILYVIAVWLLLIILVVWPRLWRLLLRARAGRR